MLLAATVLAIVFLLSVVFINVAKSNRIFGTAMVRTNYEGTAVRDTINYVGKTIADDWLQHIFHNDSSGDRTTEYHDYPGQQDRWLAQIEPKINLETFQWEGWRQITLTEEHFVDPKDLSNIFGQTLAFQQQSGAQLSKTADADGDGWADSRWVRPPISTPGGLTWLAAIRIIDTSGLVNINTATKASGTDIDGLSPADVDLIGLLDRSGYPQFPDTSVVMGALGYQGSLNQLQRDDIWEKVGRKFYSTEQRRQAQFGVPYGFADEIELRRGGGTNNFDSWSTMEVSSLGANALRAASRESAGLTKAQLQGDRRHLITVYSGNRAVRPTLKDESGMQEMVDLTSANAKDLEKVFKKVLNVGGHDFEQRHEEAARALAVNLVAARDGDVVSEDFGSATTYHGFLPHPFLIRTMLAYFYRDDNNDGHFDPIDEYASTWAFVEIGNPFPFVLDLDGFFISLAGHEHDLIGTLAPGESMVIYNNAPGLDKILPDADTTAVQLVPTDAWPTDSKYLQDMVEIVQTTGTSDLVVDRILAAQDHLPQVEDKLPKISGGYNVGAWQPLQEYEVNDRVRDLGLVYVCADQHVSDAANRPPLGSSEWTEGETAKYVWFRRDDRNPANRGWRYVLDFNDAIGAPVLDNTIQVTHDAAEEFARVIQYFPAYRVDDRIHQNVDFKLPPFMASDADWRFDNAGDLLQIFTVCRTSGQSNQTIAEELADAILGPLLLPHASTPGVDHKWSAARPVITRELDDDGMPVAARLFDSITWLTVPDEERLVYGQINVNTAPLEVLRSLPYLFSPSANRDIGLGIIDYRRPSVDRIAFANRADATGIPGLRDEEGFASVGELLAVRSAAPGAADFVMNSNVNAVDEDHRYFQSISDLISVRSDTFLAYVYLTGRKPNGEIAVERRFMVGYDRSQVGSRIDNPNELATNYAGAIKQPRVTFFSEQ